MAQITIEADPAKVSDGYHTFAELYEHRCLLFAALMRAHPAFAWRSLLHADGSSFADWFIAGMRLPTGDVTYHLPMRMWALTASAETLDKAPPWDGHTSNDVLARLCNWLLGRRDNGR